MSHPESSQAALPLVSVITATYNAAQTLTACLASVQAQDYPNLEHIVVDGASSDGTVDMLRDAPRIQWISEPDDGIYSAWNKGLTMARGEWIAFLGADDEYLPGAVTAYMDAASRNPEAIYLSSHVRWIGLGGQARIIGEPWRWPRFQRFMCTAHVGSMHSRRLFEKFGEYDTRLKIVADYEMLLRAKGELRTAFLPEVTVVMQGGGTSDSLAALDEAARVKVSTGGRNAWLASFDRVIARQKFRARQFLSK